MANPFLLYGRPLSTDEVELPLSLTGELEGYTATEAYEGRLQINNPIGRCRVEILESTAPVGLVARVDNITKEVVLKWDAYTIVEEEIKLLPNGSFEDGDDGTWTLGKGWTIENDPANAKDGSWTAKFDKFKTDGSDLNMFRIPAKINDYIRITADVKQGGSSSGSVGARVTLVFHNLEGKELLIKPGNLVVSGKDGEWKETSTEAAAPAGTAYVYAVVSAYRHAQNRPMWVDNVRWNHKYTLGQNDDDAYFVRLRVTDSMNRTADWEGYISERMNYYTSRPYGQYEFEIVDIGTPDVMSGSMGQTLTISMAEESVDIELLSLQSYAWTNASVPFAYGMEYTDIVNVELASGELRSTLRSSIASESINIGVVSVVSGDMKTLQLVSNAKESTNIINVTLTSGALA